MKSSGSVIKTRREALGLSAYALAKRVGTTPTHIGRIEDGESAPNVNLALRIAAELGCDVKELFPAQQHDLKAAS